MQKATVVAAALAAVAMAAPEARADVKGRVNVKGASFAVADAVAYKTDDGIEVALLPAAFDRKAAATDLKIDSFDVMRMDGGYVTLRIGTDGSFNCIDYSTGQGGGSSCNSDYTPALTLTANTADRVAGAFRLKAGSDSADVTFDLKVESTVARTGTALPAGGGDPGRAVMAHFAALEKNDFKALMATAPPEQRQMMEASEKSGEAKEMFEMLRMMSPSKVKVLGGTVDGDQATVDFEGVSDGKPAKGTATVVRIDGKWYMRGTSMR
ncbi:MAG: DUF4878 domain-containing protein [Vicinamibacterales bacterium]